MRRILDPAPFDAIGNDPEVRPWLSGDGPINTAHIVQSTDNFCFLTQDRGGAYIYHRKQAGLYEVHTLSLPASRGRQMLEARTESLRFMFTATDALEIVTVVPDGNRGADVWAARAGFREAFRREGAVWLQGEMVGASYRSLTYADWATRDPLARKAGQMFHDEIHRFTPDDHGEDPVHDAFAGAALLMVREGNAGKAVTLYNRFALHAGYAPISLLSLYPPTLDIVTAIVQITQAGLDVIHVRSARSAPSLIEDDGDARCLWARL